MSNLPAGSEIFFAFQDHGELVLALHVGGRVEQTRELTTDEKVRLFDDFVKAWPDLSSWVKCPF